MNSREKIIEQLSMMPTDRLAKAYLDLQTEYATLVGKVWNLKAQLETMGPIKTGIEIQTIVNESQKAVDEIVNSLTSTEPRVN